MRLTNPKHGNVRSMRLPLSNQAEIYKRLAEYEDTGLEPKQIEALQQENEQLQAQNGAMVEALIVANHYMPDIGQFCACGKCKTCGEDISYAGHVYCTDCARIIIDKVLSDVPTTYRNPADVEALKQARKALKTVALKPERYPVQADLVINAIAAIDKAVGK